MSKLINKPVKSNKGFTLMEVLVAVLVLSIGLLGLAALQASGLRNNFSAYALSQAVILANDMADRIRANPTEAANGLYNNINPPAGSDPDCVANNCTTVEIVQHDTSTWYDNLQNTLPNGTGTVTGDGTVFTINVMWDDARSGADGTGCDAGNPDDMLCFSTILIP